MSWPQIKKIILKCHLLLFYTTTRNHFSIRLWHVMTSGYYTTTSVDQLSSWTKKKFQSTFQSPTCTKKRSWSLVVCCPNDLQLSESCRNRNMRSMLNKLMRCTENCNTWSHLWSTERAQFFSMATPDHKTHNQHFKSWTYWATKFCLICHIHPTSHQPATTSFKHLDNFLQGKCFHNQQEAENAFQELVESWSMDFYASGLKCRNKETYFSLAKICWL